MKIELERAECNLALLEYANRIFDCSPNNAPQITFNTVEFIIVSYGNDVSGCTLSYVEPMPEPAPTEDVR